MRRFLSSSAAPAAISLLAALVVVGLGIYFSGDGPIGLARLGTVYGQGDPTGTRGYDGQFVYYIARDLHPQVVRPHLDAPAYRYQRILLPLLARALALGRLALLPWTIIFWTVLWLPVGTWAVSELLVGWGVSRWYALVYGLWAGFMIAIAVDLPETLAFGLAALGLLAVERGRTAWGWGLLALAMFARELTVFIVWGVMLSYLLQRRWKDLLGLGVVAGLPFVMFQGWLWLTFGQPGVGVGGDMATPLEIIPFMGLLRIGAVSGVLLLAYGLVFTPTIVLPCLWGIYAAARALLKANWHWTTGVLLIHAGQIPFTSYAAFREPGGMIRLATGLMLGVLLFAAYHHRRRVLNYSLFWVVLNIFLLKS